MPIHLGYDPQTRASRILPDLDRFEGTYVLGVQGAGKSGLLQNMIGQDAVAGNAVIVIDPHRDLVDNCLATLPPDCLIRTSVLDMEDEDWPFGLNVFAEAGTLKTLAERTEAADRIYHIFEVLWPEINSQQYLPTVLRSTIAIFLDNPGTTLPDMLTFFRKPEYRQRLLANVKDPSVVDDFTYEFERRNEREQDTRAQPLMNRLRGLFVGRGLVKNILGQRHQSINLRQAIERRELIFVKLPTTTMKQDARMIGTILLGQIAAAIFSFKDTAPDKRPGCSLYVDEFANFATRDFERLFSEARKFGGRITIAHQQRDQLPDFLAKPTLTARTKIVFRVEPGDAALLGKLFPGQGEFTPSLTTVRELLRTTSYYPPKVQTFIETYLRGLKKGGDVEVKGLRPSLLDYVWTGTNGRGVEPPKAKRANPVMALDNLFRQVMITHNHDVPIPPAAIEGLCNGGLGFYGALGLLKNRPVVWDFEDFPPQLVGKSYKGWYWLRKPEDAYEQLVHCLFHLRLTMHHLAQHPIGKESASLDKAAQTLMQLPKRTAWVSGSEGTFTIQTHDTPPALEGHVRTERFRQARDQSRTRYCHRREEVERQDQPAQASPQQTAHVGQTAMWSHTEEV